MLTRKRKPKSQEPKEIIEPCKGKEDKQKEDNKHLLWKYCGECKDYVTSKTCPHNPDSFELRETFDDKPSPPYCTGCGSILPPKNVLCDGCLNLFASLVSK